MIGRFGEGRLGLPRQGRIECAERLHLPAHLLDHVIGLGLGEARPQPVGVAAVIEGNSARVVENEERHILPQVKPEDARRREPQGSDAGDGIILAAAEERNLLASLQSRRIEIDDFLAGKIPEKHAQRPQAGQSPYGEPERKIGHFPE